MTLKHNLSTFPKRPYTHGGTAYEHQIEKWLQNFKEELEQLKQSNSSLMHLYTAPEPTYIKLTTEIDLIKQFLGQGSSAKKLKDEVLG